MNINKSKNRDIQYLFPPKTDNVFRIHLKTNTQDIEIVLCFELPNGEQHVRNYGNIPSHSLLEPFKGQQFELHVDGNLKGLYRLLEASNRGFTYEQVE